MSPVEESEAPGRRSRSSQRAALERTLKEGADSFRFRTLIDGVRSTPAPPRTEPEAPDSTPAEPTPEQRRRVGVLWLVGGVVVLMVVGLQVAVLYLLLARPPVSTPAATPLRLGRAPAEPQTIGRVVREAAPQRTVAAPGRIARSSAAPRRSGRASRQAKGKLTALTAEDGFDSGFVRGSISAALSGLAPWAAAAPAASTHGVQNNAYLKARAHVPAARASRARSRHH